MAIKKSFSSTLKDFFVAYFIEPLNDSLLRSA